MVLFTIFFPCTCIVGGGRRFSSPSLLCLSPFLFLLCAQNPDITHTPLMAYHCDKNGKGDKPCGQLHNGHLATSPLQRDWTRVGWHKLPLPFINTPSLEGAEG